MKQLLVAVLGLGISLISCGKKEFKRPQGSPQVAESAPSEPTYQGGPAPVEVMPQSASPQPIPVNAEQKKVLEDCLKQWPNSPFSPEALSQAKVIDLQNAPQNNGLLYSDESVSERDRLVLVNFAINIGNQSSIALKDPKAWYCLNVTAKIINNFRIELGCKSQLAILSQAAQNDHNFTVERATCP